MITDLAQISAHIRELIASGHKLSGREEMDEYKKIVQTISPLVGEAGVSIEVFSDENTSAQEMFNQGQEMFSWIPNAYIKYPCTAEGLRAAQMSVKQGIRVNITLCFSQQQAAAVYAATKGTKQPAYISPFVGRLDDIGQNGMDVVKNIKRMFSNTINTDQRHRITGTHPTTLVRGNVWSLACSADGGLVFYATVEQPQRIWKVPVDGGNPSYVAHVLGDQLTGPLTISPHGKLLAYPYTQYGRVPSGGWKVGVMPVDGGPPVKEFSIPAGRLDFVGPRVERACSTC